jgi:hypothetical protein
MKITEHPLMIVLGLILTAFLSGIGMYVWLEKQLNERINKEVPIAISNYIKDDIKKSIPELNLTTQDDLKGFTKLEKGSIIAFYAKNGDIPKGWKICDGANGTPDLRNRFIMGVSSMAEVSDAPGKGNNIIKAGTYSVSGHSLTQEELPASKVTVEITRQLINPGPNPALWFYVPDNAITQKRKSEGAQTVNDPFNISLGGQGKEHSHSLPEIDNRPEYASLLYIMKSE